MVCSGNICRSPVMERLFIARLREQLGPNAAARFAVGSAGTWAMTGDPIAPEAAATLVAYGGDPTAFAARDVDSAMLQAADLILTATREHRRLVVTMEPPVAGYTLTLREFARLLGPVTPSEVLERASGDDPTERMTAIVSAGLAQRGLVQIADPSDDDIADPYGRERSAYQRAAAEIDEAFGVVMALLNPG